MITIRRMCPCPLGLAALAAALLTVFTLAPITAAADGGSPHPYHPPVNCAQLATDPALGLVGNPNSKPDFERLQDFYRLFRAPGVAHCGGGAGPQPQNLFDALVNWVENDEAPDVIQAKGGVGAPPTRTRPLCPYPQTAVYNGTGSTDDAANFHCGGDLEKPEVVCADVLAKYKHQVRAPIDFHGTGVNRHMCLGTPHHHSWFHHDWDHDDYVRR